MVISDAERKAEIRSFLKSFGIDNVTDEECDAYLRSQDEYIEERKFAEDNNIFSTDVESVKNGSMTLQEAQEAKRKADILALARRITTDEKEPGKSGGRNV